MPQFDHFSFFNQVLWFFLFFLSFYFFITYFFLPKICYNIKFRKKKIKQNNENKNQIYIEKISRINFFNNFYKKFYTNFEFFLKQKLSVYNWNQNQVKNKLLNSILKEKIFIIINKKFFSTNKKLINY